MIKGQGPSYEIHREKPLNPQRIFNVPGVIMGIVVLCVIIFLVGALFPVRAVRMAEFYAALSPARFLADETIQRDVVSRLYPLISHMFLHANLTHLGVNMFSLMAFGAPVARRMGVEKAQGLSAAGIFVTFYFLCGIAGGLMFVFLHAEEWTLLVGASGGISGLFGALVRFAFSRTTLRGPQYAQLSPLTDKSVLVWIAAFIFGNIVFGQFSGSFGGQIAWEAHIGGFLFGLLSYPFFEKLARS